MEPTKFATVYKRAIFKITDYSFLKMVDDVKEEVLKNYLISSIVDFQNSCDIDLTDYDLEREQFNNELTSEVIEILAVGIAFHWMEAQVLNNKLLRNKIYSTDYNTYSPANLLEKANALMDSLRDEQLGMIREYSFRHSDYANLKV